VKRILLFGLLVGMMTVGAGCGLVCNYRPCGVGCDPCSCGEGCDDCCGPACGPTRRVIREPGCVTGRRAMVADGYDDCDVPCGRACGRPCGRVNCHDCDPCCDPCGSPCRVWHRGPLSCLFALFCPNTWCGPSCGKRYWGDFYSDPPDCWDPCDGYGNYSGGRCGGGHGGGCGCGGTSGHAHGYVGGQYDQYDAGATVTREGELVPRGERVVNPAPAPAGQPHRAVKQPTPQ
jgi:hypothetical protein